MINRIKGQLERFKYAKILVLILVVAAAWYIVQDVSLIENWREPELLQAELAAHGVKATFSYTLANILFTVVLIPIAPLSIAGGALFGTVVGAFYSMIGQIIGGAIVFTMLRILGEDFVHSVVEKRFLKYLAHKEKLEKQGFMTVLLLRLIPMPANVVNLIVGLTKIRFWPFVAATAAGSIPGTVIYSYMGYALVSWNIKGIILSVTMTLMLLYFAYYFKKMYNKA